jgi:precorrin-6x reductase
VTERWREVRKHVRPARSLGRPVIMVDRPAVSDATAVASTVDDALSWLLAPKSGK